MSRRRKILVGVGAGVLVLAAGIYWGALTALDDTPYFRTAAYAATRHRWEPPPRQAAVVVGPFEAGMARTTLTPVLDAGEDDPVAGKFRDLPLAGYGGRHGRPATGVHDELWVKAVALRVGGRSAVMVSADALIIPREVAEEAMALLGRDLGLTREQVYFSATHTHAGPGGWGQGVVGEAFAGRYRPGLRSWFAGQLAAAVRDALANLAPASCGEGSFRAPAFVRNRLVGDLGVVDDEFSYLVVRQTNGQTAVMGAYAAHATVLPDRFMEFSGDYPGYWQRAVERATGGTALFLAGGVGSHGPVAGAAAMEGAERMGEGLARLLMEQLSQTPLTNCVALGVRGLEVELPTLHVRVTGHRRLRPGLARRLLPMRDRTFVQALRVGDAIWLSTPCDFSGELAREIKDLIHSLGRQGVITSFNGDYIGYVIPARYYQLPGYESRTMSFFGPTLPDYLDEILRTLARQMAAPVE